MNAPLLLFVMGCCLAAVGVALMAVTRSTHTSVGGINVGSLKIEGSAPLVLALSGAAMCVFALTWNFAQDGGSSTPTTTTTTVGLIPPEVTLNTDELYFACDDGDSDACNELYWVTPAGSDDEDFGATCGYRFEDWRFAGDCPG